MPNKVFISYRREDSRYQALRIYNAFVHALPPDTVFMDVNSIPPGADFVEILEGWVQQCEVLLALIGPGWINSIDPRSGSRRLDNPEDFVRIEIRGALERKIPVVPVLLDAAEMPTGAELPDDIRSLRRRNGEFVDFRTFDADVQRLIKRLKIEKKIEQPLEAPVPQAGGNGTPQTGVAWANTLLERFRDGVAAKPLWAAAASLLLVAGAGLAVMRANTQTDGSASVAFALTEQSRQAAEIRAGAAKDALAISEKARQEAEAKATAAATALVKADETRRTAEARANDAAEALKKSDKARLDAEARAASAAAAQAKAEEGLRTAERTRFAAETAATIATTARAQADNSRQFAEVRANDAAEALKKSEKARQEAEAKVAALTKVEELRKVADTRPSPAQPPPGLRPGSDLPPSSSRTLLADIGGKSRWAIGGTAFCNAAHESFFSLEVGSGSITWIDGLGSRYVETIISSNENAFNTKTAASPPAVSAKTRKGAENYTYWRQNNSLFVLPSSGSNFYLERCR